MNNVFKTFFLLLFGAIFFVGCGGDAIQKVQVGIAKTIDKVTPTTKKEEPKVIDMRPKWVSNPDFGGKKGVVAIVSKEKIQDPAKLHYVAKMKAQAEFETRKGTNVDSTTKLRTTNDGDTQVEEHINMSSHSIQTAELEDADTYQDEQNYYLWMVEK